MYPLKGVLRFGILNIYVISLFKMTLLDLGSINGMNKWLTNDVELI